MSEAVFWARVWFPGSPFQVKTTVADVSKRIAMVVCWRVLRIFPSGSNVGPGLSLQSTVASIPAQSVTSQALGNAVLCRGTMSAADASCDAVRVGVLIEPARSGRALILTLKRCCLGTDR